MTSGGSYILKRTEHFVDPTIELDVSASGLLLDRQHHRHPTSQFSIGLIMGVREPSLSLSIGPLVSIVWARACRR